MRCVRFHGLVVALVVCGACRDESASTERESGDGESSEESSAPAPGDASAGPPPTSPPSPVAELAAGAGFVAARLEDGRIYWWGHYLDAPEQSAPLPVLTPLGGEVAAMGAAHGHSYLCVVSRAGTVSCHTRKPLMYGKGWGDTWKRRASLDLTRGLTDVVAVGASEYEACALRRDGSVVCWSYLKEPNLLPRGRERVKIEGIGTAQQLAVGSGHACALNQSGEVWCWGSGNWGQLGDADYDGPTGELVLDETRGEARIEGLAGPQPPRRVAGLDGVSALVSGSSHNCALREGKVWCWGFNASGQLGDGTHEEHAEPRQVPDLTGVVELAAGRSTTCARLQTGAVTCWGHDLTSDTSGHAYARAPWTVPGLDDAATIAVGDVVACAARESGPVACWGSNRYGSLGNGGGPASELDHVRWEKRPDLDGSH